MAWYGMKSACRVGQNVGWCLYSTPAPLPFNRELVLVAMSMKQVWTVERKCVTLYGNLFQCSASRVRASFSPGPNPKPLILPA